MFKVSTRNKAANVLLNISTLAALFDVKLVKLEEPVF